MLPKPEKPSKKSKSPEQLDLVNTINEVDRLRQKRRYLIALLLIFIGVSSIFSVYRWVQSLSLKDLKPDISLKLPQLNTESSQIDQQVKNIIVSDSWSISLYSLEAPNINLVYEFNSSHLNYNFESVIKTLSQSHAYKDSPIIDSLPQGLEYTENISTQPDYLEHQLLVNLPNQKKYLLLIRLNSSDTTLFKNTLPKLVDLLYWNKITNPTN